MTSPGDLIAPEALRAAADAAGFALDPGDIAIVETGWDCHRRRGVCRPRARWWGANQPGFAVESRELGLFLALSLKIVGGTGSSSVALLTA